MTASDTFNAALALFEQAQKESAAEHAQSDVRVAKLKAVAALEQAGKIEEAERLLAEVKAEQEEQHGSQT
jgi:hypothetical protein